MKRQAHEVYGPKLATRGGEWAIAFARLVFAVLAVAAFIVWAGWPW